MHPKPLRRLTAAAAGGIAALASCLMLMSPPPASAAVEQIRMMTTAERKAVPNPPSYSGSTAISTALSTNATGIYVVGTSTFSGRKPATTYALVHNGQIRQVHSKSGGSWMRKQAGSSGGVAVMAATFDTLITTAGGVNRNVNTLSSSVRDQFLSTAGLAGATSGGGSGTPPPMEVAPVNGSCPAGYELKLKSNPKRVTCVLMTQDYRPVDRDDGLLASAARSALDWLVPPAFARDCGALGCLAYFSFGEISAFRFVFQYNSIGGYWGFNGFGIVAVFVLPEPGP